MNDLHWGNRNSAKPKARSAGSLDKAGRVARKINWRIAYERSQAATAAREAHLRSLMGLPAARSLIDDGGGK
jgi:hypothetical protein